MLRGGIILPALGFILKSVEVSGEIIRSHGNGFLWCKVLLGKRRRLGAFSATLVRVLLSVLVVWR
jgi:hypothetical protein